MKETKKLKCFSKLKRIMLTLFAALCVGSVWADIIPLGENGVDGYIITGLGNNEVAVVFTNHTKNITWTVPANIKDIQFLVVGGGGGGGGGTSRSSGTRLSPGGGGGGGGVATGIIEYLGCGSAFNVKIGNGGSAGPAGTGGGGSGAAGAAGDTSFGVGDFTYITAKAGGSGVGYDRAPGTGASVSGRRYEVGSTAAKLESGAIFDEGAPLSDVYIAPGGASGASGGSTSKRAAGGGGGAMADGGVGSESGGGVGGVGYESSITGQTLVYGSGGGGGGYGIPGGSAGTLNAGAGSTSNNTAGSALANTGGGGGGGGVKSTSSRGAGGAGGSGVVVLRFVAQISEEEIRASIKNLPYTGYEQSVLAETDLYSVSGAKQTDIGSYKVKVTPRMGWSWVDGSVDPKEFDWAIVKGINRWVKGPTISSTSWIVGETGNVSLTPTEELEMLVGDEIEVTISKDGASPSVFESLPVDEGKYTLKYTVSGGELYEDFIYTLNFTINNPEIESLPNGVGYKLTGLGLDRNEVAVVFTNHTQEVAWTVPENLRNVEFLVVGGGGAGGAEATNEEKWTGGVGGGGGGVVTGSVFNLASGAEVVIKVGVGGTHGRVANDPIGNNINDGGMATAFASDSYFNINETRYVTALAGGSDQGFQNGGQSGGSGAGGRNSKLGKALDSFIIKLDNVIGKFYGNDGGVGSNYSCGGGGGAMSEGEKSDWGYGHGGQGFESFITGKRVVYGSGGGGGSAANGNGGRGGEGAGDGNQIHQGAGSDALPNQGGGGGGGGGGQGLTANGEAGRGGNGGSGIVVFRYSVYEAEVTTTEGSTSYATFAEAFAAAQAQDGATVKLLNDVTLAEKLTVQKAVTLDLNGCTLSETVTDSYGAIYVGTAGNLTITDSVTGGKIATDGGIVIGNYGTVTVAGGTIEAGAVAEEDVAVYNFYYNGSTYGKLTVNGGKVGRIWNCGNANITAGEVVDIDNSGAMTIAEAATVSGTVIIKNGSDAAEVPGAGTLTAPESLTVQVGNDGAEAFYVDGKWLVQVVVATIGEAKFASLDAAIAAAQATDTITLVKDIELTAFVSIAKSFTLDLNGNSINRANGTALYVNGDATVTIQGEGSVSGSQAVYVNAGTVVIKNGNFHGYNGGHAVYVQGMGNVEILDGTFSIDPSGSYDYVLNKYDADRETTSIVVKGGKFKNFNPANNGAEGANTDFCAEGLCGYVVETVAGVDFYGVAAAVATIGEAKFASLDAAIAAAGAEDEVVVVADIATDAAFEITKKVTINLNGKTIATTQADTEGNGVFWVRTGGELTLNGEGTVNGVGGNAYNIAIWADGGKVIINGGTYTNEGAQDDGPDGAHFDLIYVKNGGAVEINGGTFKCQTPKWTLNSNDTLTGTIVVNGGLFYQFNPSDCATEGAGTNWCAKGLKGAESAENAGYYEIVDAWSAPMPTPDGNIETTAKYDQAVSDALANVEAQSIAVTVNGEQKLGNAAVEALNTAFASFENKDGSALAFADAAATLDIVIEVVEVNAEDPAASTVVVKRGTEELTVKVTPTVKYFYPETKTWGSDKPESGAVLFKLVFEAPSAN